MLKRLFNSSLSAALGRSSQAPLDVCPPLRAETTAPKPRGVLLKWLTSASEQPDNALPLVADPQGRPIGSAALEGARQDFVEVLEDIRTQEAGNLLQRVARARSMRELWFLRAETFSLVAHHRDQSTAHSRLALLDNHFPKRVARPGARNLGEAAR
jgi:hypothetical protein